MIATLAAPNAIATPPVVWSALLPQLFLMVGGLLLLTIVSLVPARLPRGAYATYTVVVAGAAIFATIPLWHRVHNPKEGVASLVGGAVGLDGFSLFAIWVICTGVILAALLADGYLRREGLEGPEVYVLMLLSAAGGTTMASANDLIVLFIGLEILSIAVYVLAAMHARRVSSQEAGMKYFVLGAFSSAFLLYGIALTYGATGSTNLARIQSFLSLHTLTQNGMLLAGAALMLVGFGFKVAAVPFHMWTPDVYQGAPTPITAFMASVVKTAAFAGMLRVFAVALAAYRVEWRPLVFAIAVASMVIGSFAAIVQTNVKRMLAYSSINHAGFILIGVYAASHVGTSAALFYLLSYTFMVAGSFGVMSIVGRRGDSHHDLADYRGLSRRRPVLALVFAVFLLAQAGVPFTGGFLAKFGVIAAAADGHHWVLAVVAMVSAVVAAFLYLRIVVSMFFTEDDAVAVPRTPVPRGTAAALAVALVATLVLGIVPGPFTDLADHAVAGFALAGR